MGTAIIFAFLSGVFTTEITDGIKSMIDMSVNTFTAIPYASYVIASTKLIGIAN